TSRGTCVAKGERPNGIHDAHQSVKRIKHVGRRLIVECSTHTSPELVITIVNRGACPRAINACQLVGSKQGRRCDGVIAKWGCPRIVCHGGHVPGSGIVGEAPSRCRIYGVREGDFLKLPVEKVREVRRLTLRVGDLLEAAGGVFVGVKPLAAISPNLPRLSTLEVALPDRGVTV